MADPRGVKHDRTGDEPELTYTIDNSTITYDVTKVGGSAQVGLAVSLSGNKTVQLTADADAVLGRLERVSSDLKCRVRWRGHVKLPAGNAASVTRGLKIVGALGAASARGYIRDVASATAAEINKGRGIIEDTSDTTAVEILLG
jgi:hypothetical protein